MATALELRDDPRGLAQVRPGQLDVPLDRLDAVAALDQGRDLGGQVGAIEREGRARALTEILDHVLERADAVLQVVDPIGHHPLQHRRSRYFRSWATPSSLRRMRRAYTGTGMTQQRVIGLVAKGTAPEPPASRD